ncbi:MAG: glycine--tRNA ligase subunit beta [Xanthomonadales bacterium]|nr:glycine--tRNA ligase subunit beta [Xanthomonadales bacterium]
MTDHATLLVEIGCEELPPGSLQDLAEAFYENTRAGLTKAGLPFDESRGDCFFTPRRMAFRLYGVAERQPDQSIERKGPAVTAAFDDDGKPTPAALGFARSVGKEVDELDRLSTDKGEWLYCRVEQAGKPLSELLYPALEAALAGLPVPRPMRWSDHSFSFVRPAHWLLVMHGRAIVEGSLLGLEAGNTTRGHRVHASGTHAVPSAEDYEGVLQEARVIVDPVARREQVREQVESVAGAVGGHARITEALLHEVSQIVEWPVALACRFDESFLDVPHEALIASMEDHQKFFPVLDAPDGALSARFITVANLESRDPEQVVAGFERVIRPRLADAQFFWDQDRKTPLADRRAGLDQVLFQKTLGSLGDKSRRIAAISGRLADISGFSRETVERAAVLCKCDLLTQMVGEFPELQGIMGGYYARESGEDQHVATAIAEHYLPRHAGDALPGSDIGRLLSIADRVDTIVGILAAGLKPTGNKDPFALRRAALGLGRVLIEMRLELSLDDLLKLAAEALEGQVKADAACQQLAREFIVERLRHHYASLGIGTGYFNAALAAPLHSLADLDARLVALSGFMQRSEAASLVAANKRIGNILARAESDVSDTIDEDRFVLKQEKGLFDDVSALEGSLRPRFEAGDYATALGELAGIGPRVDAFFDGVMVMDDDPDIQANRLALLARVKQLFDRVADLSLVQ